MIFTHLMVKIEVKDGYIIYISQEALGYVYSMGLGNRKVHPSAQIGVNMIDFDEEISKFQPSLEVDQVEEVIQGNDLSDITDIIKTMLKEIKDKN